MPCDKCPAVITILIILIRYHRSYHILIISIIDFSTFFVSMCPLNLQGIYRLEISWDPNCPTPNGGMSHLLFLVARRAISIYGSRCPFASISHMYRLYFFSQKVTELATGLQIDYHHKHREDHVRNLIGECAHCLNHRDRPIILSHSPPALRIYGLWWPQMLSNSKISNAGSGWLVSRSFSLRLDVRFCSINHIKQDPIIVQPVCHSQ